MPITQYQPEMLPLAELSLESLVIPIAEANAALSRYDGALRGVVNPGVLLSPLQAQEAVLSSRIEGTEASLDEVLEFDAGAAQSKEAEQTPRGQDIREILNYRMAMAQGVEELRNRPLSLNLIKRMHGTLMDSVRGRNRTPGEFRRGQNHVGPKGCSIEDATFVPPAPQNIMKCLSNLEEYVHRDDQEKLVQLSLFHAQFELIHPFMDGNGRVGRMMLPLILFSKNYLFAPMLYISGYLEKHRDEYYARLQGISDNGEWTAWLRFFLIAVKAQAERNLETTKKILAIYDELKISIPELTRSQYAISAIDTIFSIPIFSSTQFVQFSKIPKQSSVRILGRLVADDVVNVLSLSSGRRPAIYAFKRLLDIIDEDA